MMERETNMTEVLFAERLWIVLLCECQFCADLCDLDSVDHFFDADSIVWSQRDAAYAIAVGWGLDNTGFICPKCLRIERSH